VGSDKLISSFFELAHHISTQSSRSGKTSNESRRPWSWMVRL